jgi:uncharacterized NAD(P)/FAD-binding protein YdhS
MNIKKYNIYSKLLVNGMPTPTFSASTFPPHEKHPTYFDERYKKILSVSRQKYAKPKKIVENQINKTLRDAEKQDAQWAKKKDDFKNKKDVEKKNAHEARMKEQEAAKAKRVIEEEKQAEIDAKNGVVKTD